MRLDSKNIFSQEQKLIKAEIVKSLMDVYFDSILKHKKLFENPQQLNDLCVTILILFVREFIVHLLHTFNLEHERKDLMKILFEEIKEEVNREIKKSMM